MKTFLVLLVVPRLLVAQDVTFKVDVNLVVVNVSAKDRHGKPVTNLGQHDFEIFEDGVPQAISLFDAQRLSEKPLPPLSSTNGASPRGQRQRDPNAAVEGTSLTFRRRFQDRRLIVLFFDQASMQPADHERVQRNAVRFIHTQMTAADLVSIMTFSSSFRVIEDFTDDRERLSEAIRGIRLGEVIDFADFNADRKLKTLERVATDLGAVQGKKALIYFSSGIGNTGIENLSQIRVTVDAAVRSGVSFYPIDARGLIALPPGGDASAASSSGVGILSGAVQQDMIRKLADSQETLYTLAADTGGKAILDTNDLTLGIRQAQRDLHSYYSIGYVSTNFAQDGKYRRLQVRLVSNPAARLDYRSGYYATKLRSTMPFGSRGIKGLLTPGATVTELPIALEVNYFKIANNRYFIPISVKIPGSLVIHPANGNRQVADLELLGAVRDSSGEFAGGVHDRIRVKVTEDPPHKALRPLQYDTGLTLSSGSYSLIFVIRDDQTGKIGTFETRFAIPDLDSGESPRVSSIILSSQKEALSSVAAAVTNRNLQAAHPLVREGKKTVPNITRVFHMNQTLYVYFEVYEPSIDRDLHKPSVTAELALLSPAHTAYRVQPVRLTQPDTTIPGVIRFSFQIPLAKLEAGEYVAQVTIIDEVGRKFAIHRDSIRVVNDSFANRDF